MAGHCPKRQSSPKSQANAGPIWVMIFAKSGRLAGVLRLLGASFYSPWRGLAPRRHPQQINRICTPATWVTATIATRPYRFTLTCRLRCVTRHGPLALAAGIARCASSVWPPWPPGGAGNWCGLPGGARDLCGDDVGGVPVQAAPGPVAPDRGAWVCMGGGFVHVAPAGPRHPARR